MFVFEINNQTLTKTDSFEPATDSVGYLKAQFKFNTDDWLDTVKTAFFKSKNGVFSRALVNDECEIPAEAIARHGSGYINLIVSVVGTRPDGYRIPTTEKTIRFNNSGYVDITTTGGSSDSVDKLKNKIIVLEGEKTILTNENDRLKNTVNNLENENAELTETVEELNSENSALETANEELTASNETLQNVNDSLETENTELEARVNELETSIKPEQEKTLDITENGSYSVTPDEGKTLSNVAVNVAVPSSGGTEELETLIDSSGVLDSTDGTATEKVEELIDYTDLFKKATGILFHESKIETITMDCSHFTNLNGTFDGCRKIKEIHLSNTQNVKTWQYFLYSCNVLTTVETLDLSGRVGNNSWMVAGIDNLRTFKVVPETILTSISIPAPKLSDGTDGTFNSIQSIVDGLATVETTQKLTLHTDVVIKITDEQIAEIISKNWEVG